MLCTEVDVGGGWLDSMQIQDEMSEWFHLNLS